MMYSYIYIVTKSQAYDKNNQKNKSALFVTHAATTAMIEFRGVLLQNTCFYALSHYVYDCYFSTVITDRRHVF